jgi:hypothetical protein
MRGQRKHRRRERDVYRFAVYLSGDPVKALSTCLSWINHEPAACALFEAESRAARRTRFGPRSTSWAW